MDVFNLEGTKKDARTELELLKIKIDIAVCFNSLKKLGFTADDIDDMRKQIINNTPTIKEEYTKIKTEIEAADFYERNPEEHLRQAFKQKMEGR